jgi:hypothetical protein
MLTDEEVQTLKNDPRVLDIHRPYYDIGLKITPFVTQTSDLWLWDKSNSNSPSHVNWGLLRGYLGSAVSGWGSNGTTSVPGTINLPNIGRHVDVVICDGHIRPDHPEFAVNANGTGGTRVRQPNWFEYIPQVKGIDFAPGNYVYDFGSSAPAIRDNNHGCHVAGTAAGNTGGWARGANIYNISPYLTTTNADGYVNRLGLSVYPYDVIDYIRQWHAHKRPNSDTGRRNPTIVNMSWGVSGDFSLAESNNSPNFDVDKIDYGSLPRGGRTVRRPVTGWDTDDLDRAGLVCRPIRNSDGAITDFRNGSVVNISALDTSFNASIRDAIAEGIIFVGAAGNNSAYADLPDTDMYERTCIGTAFTFAGLEAFFVRHYMVGMAPGNAPGVICVGAVDSVTAEQKTFFSTSGPRVDVYAPGHNIMSSVNTQGGNAVADPRNPNFFKEKYNGTSMASPQVAGIIACALETYPNMTQTQALSYIQTYANHGALQDSPFDTRWESNLYKNFYILHNSPNKYATYQPNTRPNQVQPAIGHKSRPATGGVYPRTRITRTQ